MKIFVAIVTMTVTLGFTAICGQEEGKSANLCVTKTNCKDCITSDPECAWCTVEDFDSSGNSRCDLLNTVKEKCPNQFFYVKNSIKIIKDQALSKAGAETEKVVQLAPQHIKLRLRPGAPEVLTVKFRQAEDYPVDLYYIMDLSKTMETHKQRLAVLGKDLADSMKKITKKFQLGFGSFVDKVVMPYTSTVPEMLLEPCTGCAAPYGFKNHMSLSQDTQRFEKEVSMAPVSGNLDAPEGGLDAIMQAMVCEKDISWRNLSRKLIVFSTDSGFHIAGDGKLGGIVKPNDGNCHLDGRGYYAASTEQDYPSLGQLRQTAEEKKMHIIFAVVQKEVSLYSELSENLVGSATGRLDQNSENVVNLIRGEYEKITSTVVLRDTAPLDKIQVTYHSDCSGVREKTYTCKNLTIGREVSFDVSVELVQCPANRAEWNHIFTINPVGVAESLTVEVEMICECDCEKPGQGEEKSPKCTNGNGTFECGMCNCYNNRYGRHCECGRDSSTRDLDDSSCRKGNSSQICSGRGQCVCGVCDCTVQKVVPDGKIYGTYCECDNFSCDYKNNKICSGHGQCTCNGTCKCHNGWKGKACECTEDTESCKAPGSSELCSGNGECQCGSCRCKEIEDGRYIGKFCEECPKCAQKCDMYRPCVECKLYDSEDNPSEKCLSQNCNMSITLVDRAEQRLNTERVCVFKDDDGCKFTFVYGFYDKDEPSIKIQKERECPTEVNPLPIVLGVVGGIVIIGLLLLLLWKLLTTIHDRREFARFENERQNARWDKGENPIYKQATSTFQNPTYGGH